MSRSPGRHARTPGQWRHHLRGAERGIVPLRALDASGGAAAGAWDIAAAFAWAADHGARVVDASLSGIGPSRVMADRATAHDAEAGERASIVAVSSARLRRGLGVSSAGGLGVWRVAVGLAVLFDGGAGARRSWR